MRSLPKTLISVIALGWVLAAIAETFTVNDIRVEGLQRISAGTVFNYLPIKIGDEIDSSATSGAIRTLFGTGFFKDIRIEREDQTLVVFVVERPAIANIEFEGNVDINTDDLMEQLRQIDFAVGRVFNQSDFDQVKRELQRLYFAAGKYGVIIDSTVTPLERNRVGVRFNISEGKIATIKDINIVGNEVYGDHDLLDLMSLSTSGWLTWLSKKDQYSRQKLAADIEVLRSFYLDRGYVDFIIDSTQVSLTPDKKDVYVTINLTEGNQYVIDKIQLTGDLIVPKEELFGLITVSRGEVFSRKEITRSTKNIADRLGEEGYAFANINPVPEIDEDDNTVAITFYIDPGNRVYVRRINFAGNTKTRDEVLRREMRQMEGGWISTKAVERSRVRLRRLGFFDEVNVETPAVGDSADQVDINFTVTERPTGNLAAGAGFSQEQGLLLSTSLTQDNFLGTGHRVNAAFNTSSANRAFNFRYVNPYFTDDGVSLGLNAGLKKTNASEANVSDYTMERLFAGVETGVPINEFDTIDFAAQLEQVDFTPGTSASSEIIAFRDLNGSQFNNLLLTVEWDRDTRNSRFFATRGSLSRISTELGVPGSDLSFYKLKLRHQQFFPLAGDFAFMINGGLGYGDGLADTEDLPLTENFFAGGAQSVRGYEANTLGPRDSLNQPLGGDLKFAGTSELILPLPFLEDARSVRVTGFFDFGNVYGPDEDFDLGEMRGSIGISTVWLSPLGALSLSAAEPLNNEAGDSTQSLQFSFGTSF